MSDLIRAILVFDGGDVIIPEPMLRRPIKKGQFEGTELELLAEVAGRVCYDSFGVGRSSEEWHKHILEVGHTSVYRHCNFTVNTMQYDYEFDWRAVINRPGVRVEGHFGLGLPVRLTLNLEAAMEIEKNIGDSRLKRLLVEAASRMAPAVIEDKGYLSNPLLTPETEHECFVTLFLSGSRNFSHEMVRHHHECAVSQRSTRYVDESETPYVIHPVMEELMKDGRMPSQDRHSAKLSYEYASDLLTAMLSNRGVNPATARKQARGAARSFLPTNLYTEMIFTASVAQWKRMLKARCSIHADAEIREVFAKALGELKRSRHGSFFRNYELAESPDGIGSVVVEKKCHD